MTGPHQSWFSARIGELVRTHPDWAHQYHTDPYFHRSVDELPVFIARALNAYQHLTHHPIDLTDLPVQAWLEHLLDDLHRDAQEAATWRHETIEALNRIALPDLPADTRRLLGLDKDPT